MSELVIFQHLSIDQFCLVEAFNLSPLASNGVERDPFVMHGFEHLSGRDHFASLEQKFAVPVNPSIWTDVIAAERQESSR